MFVLFVPLSRTLVYPTLKLVSPSGKRILSRTAGLTSEDLTTPASSVVVKRYASACGSLMARRSSVRGSGVIVAHAPAKTMENNRVRFMVGLRRGHRAATPDLLTTCKFGSSHTLADDSRP